MQIKNRDISDLIVKFLRDELTEMERIQLENLLEESPPMRKLFFQLSQDENLKREMIELYGANKSIKRKIDVAIAEENVIHIERRRKWKYAAAAAIFLILGSGGYTIYRSATKPVIAKVTPIPLHTSNSNDVAPGMTRASLKLSDGSVISLDGASNGKLADQGNTEIINNDGKLVYEASKKGSEEVVGSNSLYAPKGGQYNVKLSDGTIVWLNAASSITYPVRFTGKERRVQITGECYFEVAHVEPTAGKAIPFKVSIHSSNGEDKGEVEVLGTHFNINAYDDEATVKTTLLEGSVRMHKGTQSALLKPGEQAQAISKSGDEMIGVTRPKDVEDFVAWKEGYFSFHNDNIESVMRQVSRWYDIQVEFVGEKPKDHFIGSIPRSVNLSKMLKILEGVGINFKIEGTKLKVIQGR